MKARKNQANLTATEWENFICAFRNLKEGFLKGVEKPSLDDFADEHAIAFKDGGNGKLHEWEAHTHGDHTGRKFLAWHRVFLNEFEKRLQREVPDVTIPYWNAFKDPFPEELKKISDNEGKRVDFPANSLGDLLPDFTQKDFEVFQLDLEGGYHNHVHAELGRTIGRAHAPRDAGFWLHHAFVDRQWGHWLVKHDGELPSTMDEMIKGDQIVIGKKVSDVLHTTQLGYVYGNGIYYNIEKQGSTDFSCILSKDTILCVKLPNEDFYAKLWVPAISSAAVFITMQQFPFFRPGSKLPIWAGETMYCDLRSGKLKVEPEQAHVQIVKKTAGATVTYQIKALNGTRMAIFNGLTNFAANDGEGTVDPEMLYI
ncbi:putative Tyrosinase [Candidatus Nitrospira nitrosa]|uniref:Putative Tyrosinase n=1 Tax=Candidatus Nitrospira nitrosa TaxID=1742972 RepID=A0A0S4LNR0_9BACT|nr:tyrosinase family protein [Candidatus Nitrospira nitrosa]CUS38558.1 putative Tyrosinase [Candidatus Nitrospira nitrosa]